MNDQYHVTGIVVTGFVALTPPLSVWLKTLFENDSQVDILNGFPFRRRYLREAQGLVVIASHDGQCQLIIQVIRRRKFEENI